MTALFSAVAGGGGNADNLRFRAGGEYAFTDGSCRLKSREASCKRVGSNDTIHVIKQSAGAVPEPMGKSRTSDVRTKATPPVPVDHVRDMEAMGPVYMEIEAKAVKKKRNHDILARMAFDLRENGSWYTPVSGGAVRAGMRRCGRWLADKRRICLRVFFSSC